MFLPDCCTKWPSALGIPFHNQAQICCQGKVFDRISSSLCCNDQVYSERIEECVIGTVQEVTQMKECEDEEYNYKTEICCGNPGINT